ncbi:hypothetical protein GPALN_015057 [Globodera pallida]|nr:hypothetical protein GPALN_015057 [Globodera pallida]
MDFNINNIPLNTDDEDVLDEFLQDFGCPPMSPIAVNESGASSLLQPPSSADAVSVSAAQQAAPSPVRFSVVETNDRQTANGGVDEPVTTGSTIAQRCTSPPSALPLPPPQPSLAAAIAVLATQQPSAASSRSCVVEPNDEHTATTEASTSNAPAHGAAVVAGDPTQFVVVPQATLLGEAFAQMNEAVARLHRIAPLLVQYGQGHQLAANLRCVLDACGPGPVSPAPSSLAAPSPSPYACSGSSSVSASVRSNVSGSFHSRRFSQSSNTSSGSCGTVVAANGGEGFACGGPTPSSSRRPASGCSSRTSSGASSSVVRARTGRVASPAFLLEVVRQELEGVSQRQWAANLASTQPWRGSYTAGSLRELSRRLRADLLRGGGSWPAVLFERYTVLVAAGSLDDDHELRAAIHQRVGARLSEHQ